MTVFLCARCRRSTSAISRAVSCSPTAKARLPERHAPAACAEYLLPRLLIPISRGTSAGRHLPRHQAEPGSEVGAHGRTRQHCRQLPPEPSHSAHRSQGWLPGGEQHRRSWPEAGELHRRMPRYDGPALPIPLACPRPPERTRGLNRSSSPSRSTARCCSSLRRSLRDGRYHAPSTRRAADLSMRSVRRPAGPGRDGGIACRVARHSSIRRSVSSAASPLRQSLLQPGHRSSAPSRMAEHIPKATSAGPGCPWSRTMRPRW